MNLLTIEQRNEQLKQTQEGLFLPLYVEKEENDLWKTEFKDGATTCTFNDDTKVKLRLNSIIMNTEKVVSVTSGYAAKKGENLYTEINFKDGGKISFPAFVYTTNIIDVEGVACIEVVQVPDYVKGLIPDTDENGNPIMRVKDLTVEDFPKYDLTINHSQEQTRTSNNALTAKLTVYTKPQLFNPTVISLESDEDESVERLMEYIDGIKYVINRIYDNMIKGESISIRYAIEDEEFNREGTFLEIYNNEVLFEEESNKKSEGEEEPVEPEIYKFNLLDFISGNVEIIESEVEELDDEYFEEIEPEEIPTQEEE